MPEATRESIFTAPEDSEVLRQILLTCLTEYQLVDEQLTRYATKIGSEIDRTGTFNIAMFDLCVEEDSKKKKHNLTSTRLMYLALHHPLSWQELLNNAEQDPSLKDTVPFLIGRAAAMPIMRSFQQKLLHTLAYNILLALTHKISPQRNPEEITQYLKNIGSTTAEELLPNILDAPLPASSPLSITSEHLTHDSTQTEQDLYLYAQRMLNMFEKNTMVERLLVLCRLGMVHAFDALQSLFLSFSVLFQSAKILTTIETRINHQLALLIVFSSVQKKLDAKSLFGKRAQLYEEDLESVVLLRSAGSYRRWSEPNDKALYSSLFEPLIKRIANHVVAPSYPSAYLSAAQTLCPQ